MFSAWWSGRRAYNTITDRLDPDLQVTLNLALIDGVVEPAAAGTRTRLTDKGRELARLLERLSHKKLVLIDTAGMGPRDGRLTEQLAALKLGAGAAKVLLALPVKVTCREDCKGLCPQCGKNLNQEQCSCTNTLADPRWSALKEIRGRLEH